MATSYSGDKLFAAPTGQTNYAHLTKQLWDTKLHAETQDALFFQRGGMIAEDKDELSNLSGESPAFAPIMKKSELGRERGDTMRLGLLKGLSVGTAYGKTGMTTLTDSEVSLVLYNMDIKIDLWRQGVRVDGLPMATQRSPFKTGPSAAARAGLRAWMSGTIDLDMFYALYNGSSYHVITEYALSAVAHPNIKYAGQAEAIEQLDNSMVFDASMIERIAAWAEVNNIQPMSVGDFTGYCLVIHPWQAKTLRADSTWHEDQQTANVRGSKNPLFRGGDTLGEYAGIVLKKSNQIMADSTYTNVRKAILLGGHALGYAVGREAWTEEREAKDFNIKGGWSINTIWGCARADWTSDDSLATKLNQSSALVYTYAADPG